MTFTEAEIDAFILAKHEAGVRPNEIANRLRVTRRAKLSVNDVRRRLERMGIELDEGPVQTSAGVARIWTVGASNDERRQAVWKRQRDGARAALRAGA